MPTAIAQSRASRHVTFSVPEYSHGSSRSVQSFVSWAEHLLRDLGLTVPDREHLESTVRLALRAQEFFFAAALHHPDKPQLDHFFRQFITLAAVPTPPPEKRFSW